MFYMYIPIVSLGPAPAPPEPYENVVDYLGDQVVDYQDNDVIAKQPS